LCGVLGVILWAAFSLLGVIVRKQHSPIRERQSALVR
jgi:hypothetical protein